MTRVSQSMAAITDYKVQFQLVNALASGSFIRVIVPTDQAIVPSSGIVCKLDLSQVTLPCRIVYRISTEVYIDISLPSTYNSGTTLTLIL